MNRRNPSAGPASSRSRPGSGEAGDPPSSEGAAPPFEAAIKRLNEIVQSLERGDLPLEESLRLFEEGVQLSRVSQQRLDAAERRVEQLLAVDEQGRPRTEPFSTDSADEDAEEEDAPF